MGEPKKFVLFDDNYREFREGIINNNEILNDFMKESNKTLNEHTQALTLLTQKIDYIRKKLNI